MYVTCYCHIAHTQWEHSFTCFSEKMELLPYCDGDFQNFSFVESVYTVRSITERILHLFCSTDIQFHSCERIVLHFIAVYYNSLSKCDKK